MDKFDASTMAEQADKTIGEMVADDYRTARVFDKHGIDFCCGGAISLRTACRERGIELQDLLDELKEVKDEPAERSLNYLAWELPFLADYIMNTHHSYIREELETIAAYARKIAEVHGQRHPEVVEIAALFTDAARELMAHLRQEEEVLFPAIRRLDGAKKAGIAAAAEDINLIKLTLDNLSQDHVVVGDAVHKIRDLSRNYTIPEDACTTFALTYQKLQEFENDLHKHVHLENNILFPKAEKL